MKIRPLEVTFLCSQRWWGLILFLPCLSIGRSVWRTSTNELQSTHSNQSARGAAVVNYWVRSNNSNSGDFPEARANRVILKSTAITRGLYPRMPSPCYHASRINIFNDINKFGLSRSGGSNANDLYFQIIIIR